MTAKDSDSALAMTETAVASTQGTGRRGNDVVSTPATIGRYTIERELGRGGMGVVYAAYEPELQRRVALKVLAGRETSGARERFLREARALARLSHPNVVTVYEIATADGHDVIAMELVDGTTLADWLRAQPRTTTEILDAFTAAGRALEAAHSAGLVHRDFKPHNVLRDKRGRTLVTDFGLASAIGVDPAHPSPPVDSHGDTAPHERLTVTGAWVGTPAYMAPEQWAGGDIVPATDQFAFCVALWEALAGRRPFRGDSLDELRAAVASGAIPVDGARVPRRLRPILTRGLHAETAKRWPDMGALLAALGAAQQGRRRIAYGAALVALVAATAVVVGVAMRASDGTPSASNGAGASNGAVASDGSNGARGSNGAVASNGARGSNSPGASGGSNGARAGSDAAPPRSDASSTAANADDAERAALLPQVTRFSDGHVTAPVAAIDAVRDELARPRVRGIAIVPSVTNGVPVGLRLFAVRPGTFLNAVGFSNGDTLVALDGHAVRTPEELQRALATVSSSGFRVDVRRGSTVVTLDLKGQ